MNYCEKITKEFLEFSGYKNPVYEPRGNVTPDFLIDSNIGVEVRRLNQNYFSTDGKIGFEEIELPLYYNFKEILSSYGPSKKNTWLVNYYFQNSRLRLDDVKSEVKNFLDEFISQKNKKTINTELSCGLTIEIFKSPTQYKKLFKLGGHINYDRYNWIYENLKKNIKYCIKEKTNKISEYRNLYDKWWLVLVDMISYGADNYEKEQIMDNINHEWDRSNPLNMENKFVKLTHS